MRSAVRSTPSVPLALALLLGAAVSCSDGEVTPPDTPPATPLAPPLP